MKNGPPSAPLTTKAALLQELTRGGGYGTQLVDRIEDKSRDWSTADPLSGWRIRPGVLYPALRALEKEKLIKSKRVKRGGRDIVKYEITKTGRAVARANKRLVSRLFREG